MCSPASDIGAHQKNERSGVSGSATQALRFPLLEKKQRSNGQVKNYEVQQQALNHLSLQTSLDLTVPESALVRTLICHAAAVPVNLLLHCASKVFKAAH